MAIDERIDTGKLPKHVAVIMDGNGRWAKQRGEKRIFGHQNGVRAVKETVEAAAELGVSYLTLYAFSTENWNRPQEEVNALMELLVSTIRSETDTLNKNQIRLLAIGDIDSLPENCRRELQETIDITSGNTRLSLVLALSYSAKWELTRAVKNISMEVLKGALLPENITESLFSEYLSTKGIPDPELLIRTSGERRVSNFLLWQLAYAEFYFTDVLWPDFDRQEFFNAIVDFQNRERRFGLTSEQISE
jgi:undecaprenyl diphosphate synthase